MPTLDRRSLIFSAALAAAPAAAAAEPGPSKAVSAGFGAIDPARLEALRVYVERHREAYDLPGLTLCLVTPGGGLAFIASGYADRELRRPILGDELFQIGSISKSMTSLCIFKAVARGELELTDDIRARVPGLKIDSEAPVTLAHLLHHTSGLPDDAPPAPRITGGKLWTGYAPGARWSYSNTGYDLLTRALEHLHGQPMETILREEVFAPLGFKTAASAIRQEDRARYAEGYSPAAPGLPYLRRDPLVRAPWSDLTSGDGCVAMTAADMALYLRFILAAGVGRGAPLLPDALALRWTSEGADAPGWAKGAQYAYGLARVLSDGRTLLHHTGGMTAFSSSVHADPLSGVACFASTNMGSTNYRPREITRYAVGLFGRTGPIKDPPPAAAPPNPLGIDAGAYIDMHGRQLELLDKDGAPAASFEGQTGALEAGEDDARLARHPLLRRFPLWFERDGKGPPRAIWYGGEEFAREGAAVRPPAPPELLRLAGRFDDSGQSMRVSARPMGLFLNGATPLTPLGGGRYLVGADAWGCERIVLDSDLAGRPDVLNFSGGDFERVADRA